MQTLTISTILACNYAVSFLLFAYYRTIRLLTLDKELRASLFPRWYSSLLVVKFLFYIATAVYLVMGGHLEYLLIYTVISLVLNGLGPVPYSLIEEWAVRSACKRRHLHAKLDIFLTLIGEAGKSNSHLDNQTPNKEFTTTIQNPLSEKVALKSMALQQMGQ